MNESYKTARIINKILKGPEDKEVFHFGGLDITEALLQSFRVGENHHNFRKIREEELAAYLKGIIAFLDSQKVQ